MERGEGVRGPGPLPFVMMWSWTRGRGQCFFFSAPTWCIVLSTRCSGDQSGCENTSYTPWQFVFLYIVRGCDCHQLSWIAVNFILSIKDCSVFYTFTIIMITTFLPVYNDIYFVSEILCKVVQQAIFERERYFSILFTLF